MRIYILTLVALLVTASFLSAQTNQSAKYNNPTSEFLNGYTSKYECDGTGKGKGLKFSIKYPQSWKSREGNRPHIVRKFINNGSIASAMLILNDMGFVPVNNEIEDIFSDKYASKMIPKGSALLRSNKTVIEGQPALVIDYTSKNERLGVLVKSRFRTYIISYKSYLLNVQFSVSQMPYDAATDLDKRFNEYEMLFNAMINSLVINSKWENY